MKKVITLGQACGVFAALDEASNGNISIEGISSIVDAVVALEPHWQGMRKYRQTLIDKLTKGKSEDDSSWMTAANNAIEEKSKAMVEVELPELPKELIMQLGSANNWKTRIIRDIISVFTNNKEDHEA